MTRAIVICSLCLTACYTTADVTNDPAYQIGYVPGSTYVLEQDLLAYGSREPLVLFTKDSDSPYKPPGGPVLVPIGTRIRVDGLVRAKVTALQSEASTAADAWFIDGPLAGRRVALVRVSDAVQGPDIGILNSIEVPRADVLRRIEPSSRR